MPSADSPYLTPEDFGEIRELLGFAASDTTSLPDTTIEGRLYLGRVARLVDPVLSSESVDMDPDTGDASTIEEVLSALVYLSASYLCAWIRRTKSGEERAAERAGPFSVNYRSGPEWQSLAAELWDEGISILAGVLGSAIGDIDPRGELDLSSTSADVWIALDGPTRAEEDDPDGPTVDDRLDEILPRLIGGE